MKKEQKIYLWRCNYFARSLNCFAQRPAARLAIKNVRYEEILRCVHYECALLHVTSNAEERQEAYPTLGY